MTDPAPGGVTICFANYRTLELTRLCLRAIRKFTHAPYRVIVVDNDSRDDSLEYLRSLSWIELIERRFDEPMDGGVAHATALDAGFERCETEFFLAIHSDTIALRDDWLNFLVDLAGEDPRIASVGTGKAIRRAPAYDWLRRTFAFKRVKAQLFNEARREKYRHYSRSHCALYRTALIRAEGLRFYMPGTFSGTAGKKLYFELEDRGYPTRVVPATVMAKYIAHIGHATLVVNRPQNVREKAIRTYRRLHGKIFDSELARALLEDESLDK
ncbi:MAG: glycosyltransferase family 2 protein [Myxococcales bacterium]|nr:glycosyltransferase family 2 protein [Myxococcales bacterium]